MSEERITERTDGTTSERVTERAPAGSNTTVIERRGGGGMGTILIAIILIAILAVGGWFLLNMNRQEAAQTNAISGAAESVGNAADRVGDAAGRAADAVTPNN